MIYVYIYIYKYLHIWIPMFGLFSAQCNRDRTFTLGQMHDALELRWQSLSSQSFRSCGCWKAPHFWKRPKPCGVARRIDVHGFQCQLTIYIGRTCFHRHPWESSPSFCTWTCRYHALALMCPTAKVHACWQLLSRPHHCREADLREVTPPRHQWKGVNGTWNKWTMRHNGPEKKR